MSPPFKKLDEITNMFERTKLMRSILQKSKVLKIEYGMKPSIKRYRDSLDQSQLSSRLLSLYNVTAREEPYVDSTKKFMTKPDLISKTVDYRAAARNFNREATQSSNERQELFMKRMKRMELENHYYSTYGTQR